MANPKQTKSSNKTAGSNAVAKPAAKSAMAATDKGKVKKSTSKPHKVPVAPPESSSESESESDASKSGSDSDVGGSDSNESDSASESRSDSSESGSDSGRERVSKPASAKAAKTNGTAGTNGVASAGSNHDVSEGSGGSESSSDTAARSQLPKTNAVRAADADGSSSDSSESESESDSGVTGKKAGANGVEAESESDSDDDSDSSDNASNKNEVAPTPAAANKRKADTIEEPVAKKSKVIESDQPKNLFVGNLSWNVDEEWLRREFEEFGEVLGCRIVTDRESGRSKGFGYVDFATSEEAAKALDAKKGSELDGRPLNIDFSEPRKDNAGRDKVNDRGKKFGDVQSPPSDTLFIANLSFDTTAEILKENFQEYGTITRVSLPTHQDSGQLKGFGYVGFSSVEEAQAALDAWKGESLLGRPIRVDFSTPRPDNGFGNSRGGRGGGGFRGRGGGDRGGRGFGGGRGRGGSRGGSFRGGSTNRGGVGDFSGKKMTF